MTDRPDPLKVLAVCGLGMGTSLILRMTTESVLQRLDVRADVDNSDLSAARSTEAHMIVGQGMHVSELDGAAPVIVTVDDFVDEDALESRLRPALVEAGWL